MFDTSGQRPNAAGSPLLRLSFLPVLSCLVLGLTTISPAHAAVTVPNSVSPGQVEKRFEAPQEAPPALELNLPAPTESQQLSDAARAKLEQTKFTLQSVVVEGSTVYKAEDLQSIYADKIGQTISLLDARAIASAITDKYHNDGYILSQAVVPAQDVAKGVLKIRVVEGFISDVTFQGDEQGEGQKRVLAGYADNIKALKPARIDDLERYMLLMNDLPGANVTGLIRPSATAFGGADLVLTINNKQFDGSYSFDNRGSKYIGPWQHTATLGANSLLNDYDRTELQMETADPFKELFGVSLQHDEMLDNQGTKLSLLASHTATHPGDALKVLDLYGDSNLFEAKVSHPFLRLREQSFTGRAVFDVHNTETDVFTDQPLAVDRLRVARVGGTYSFLDTMRGSNALDVALSQGMDIFSATSSGANRSNTNGDSSFTKSNFDLSRTQRLPGKFSVLTAATGQFAFEPLLVDEQFSLGGSEYGRAFDPSEALGDSGVAGKAELRYTDTPGEAYFESYQLYGFYDIGKAWLRDAAAGTPGNTTLSSVGAGARVNFNDYLSSSLEFDVPVIKAETDQTSYRHDPRIFFSISAHF